jgi:hypothetical protein
MPYSSVEGKDWIKRGVERLPLIRAVTDVGPGSGTYYDLLKDCADDAEWTAIEKWGPYVKQFGLEDKYDNVVVGDALWFDWDELPRQTITILGDVMEHLEEEDAKRLLYKAMIHSRLVILSIPIVHYPQGEEMGNPHEAHLSDWTDGKISTLLDGYIAAKWIGEVVGVYVLSEMDDDLEVAKIAFGEDPA